MHLTRVIPLLSLLVGLLQVPILWAASPPAVGTPHPDFVLPRIDNGEAIRLSQFRGKKVLLIHFASW